MDFLLKDPLSAGRKQSSKGYGTETVIKGSPGLGARTRLSTLQGNEENIVLNKK